MTLNQYIIDKHRRSIAGVIYLLIPALLFVLLLPLHSHIPHHVQDNSLLHDDPQYVGQAVTHIALPDLTTSDLDSITEVDFSNDLLHKKILSADLTLILLNVFALWGLLTRPRTYSSFPPGIALAEFARYRSPPLRAPPRH